MGIVHGGQDGVMLEKGDDTVHRPDGRKGRDGEKPIEIKAEGRETGAGSVQMRGGLRGEQAKPALGGNARFTETPVVP